MSVAGAGDTTLTATNGAIDQARNDRIDMTGVVTGNANVIVPTAPKRWTFKNSTTGAFTRTVKTSAGSGILVPQGKTMLLRCDGTNVVEDVDAIGTLDVIGVLTARGALDESKGVDIVAAATTNIFATDGNYLVVTGNTGITSFGTAARAGARRKVRFTGTPTITNGANLICPTGANIPIAAGDVIEVYADTTTQHRIVSVNRADGSALTVPATITGTKTFTSPTTFQSTDAGAGEIVGIDLDRFSASPAANDLLMALRWLMRDAGAGTDVAAKLLAKLLDPTAGSEDAELEFHTIVAGALAIRAVLGQGLRLGSPTGGDKGAGSINAAAGYFANNVPVPAHSYAAKTADYTVVAADNGGVVRWTTAGFAANLTAAATLGDGFRVKLMNAAASGDVTINPNASETIDGLLTRLLRPGDAVELVVAGGNWITVDGAYSFYSADQTINNATLLTLAHGLGVAPRVETDIFAYLENTSAELGYSLGDQISYPIFNEEFGSSGGFGLSVSADATNISVREGSAAAVMSIVNKTTGATAQITPASWNFFIVARIRYPGRR